MKNVSNIFKHNIGLIFYQKSIFIKKKISFYSMNNL